MTDPPFIGVAAALVAGLRGARVVHWVQDIYPEIAASVTGKQWLLVLRPLRNLAWRRSVRCVVPGADMALTMARNRLPRSKILMSENWPTQGLTAPDPTAVAALRTTWRLDGKFVAAYSGNLGRVHELRVLIELAAALRDDSAFAFVFIGAGAQREELEREVRQRELQNVSFHPPQPRSSLSTTLGVADVHFVTLRAGAEASVFPSKLYGICEVGRPVLFVGSDHCQIAQLIRERALGLAFTADQGLAMAEALRTLRSDPIRCAAMRSAAAEYARGGFARALTDWESILSAALPPRSMAVSP